MEEYLSRNHFDIIITTHLFPAEILTCMKQKGIHIPKTVFIATDYTCIPFTEETECDAYIIPSDKLKGGVRSPRSARRKALSAGHTCRAEAFLKKRTDRLPVSGWDLTRIKDMFWRPAAVWAAGK